MTQLRISFKAGFVLFALLFLTCSHDPGKPDRTNRSPIIDPVGEQHVFVGDSLSLVVSATDPDQDSLHFRSALALHNASLYDLSKGKEAVRFFADSTSVGANFFELIASDGSLEDTIFFEVIVDYYRFNPEGDIIPLKPGNWWVFNHYINDQLVERDSTAVVSLDFRGARLIWHFSNDYPNFGKTIIVSGDSLLNEAGLVLLPPGTSGCWYAADHRGCREVTPELKPVRVRAGTFHSSYAYDSEMCADGSGTDAFWCTIKTIGAVKGVGIISSKRWESCGDSLKPCDNSERWELVKLGVR